MTESMPMPRFVDQDAPHGLGGGGEKLGAAAPERLPVTAQPQPRFVDERRGLQCLAGRLAGHPGRSEFSKLFVYHRQDSVRRPHIAALDPPQEQRHLTLGRLFIR